MARNKFRPNPFRARRESLTFCKSWNAGPFVVSLVHYRYTKEWTIRHEGALEIAAGYVSLELGRRAR